MSYLNVDEVDSALKALAQTYPSLSELITLPNPTVQGRTCYALRIGTDSVADGVLFTGCAHAREWGGADICVYFAADLLEAYTAGTGLAYGGKSFSSFTIRSIVENLNVVLFPCVNPDGRAFDQQYDVLWRKNRNPAASAGDPQRVGVDINRNHSFLWDFRTKFDPQAMNFGTLASDDPGSDIYHGSAPDSEPESRNVHWLLDTYRFTRWYLDIHSYTGDMLFVWGDDTDQSTNPTENFRNSAYDGQRGVEGGYAEYIPSADLNLAAGTAQRVVNAINAVRGGNYEAKQSVFLRSTSTGISSPVSGAVDDYAYSRHCRTARRERCTRSPSSSAIGLVTFGRAFTRPGRRWSKSWQRSTPAWPSSAHQPHPAFVPPWEVAYRHLWPWQIWDPMVRTVEPVVRPLVERALTLARRG